MKNFKTLIAFVFLFLFSATGMATPAMAAPKAPLGKAGAVVEKFCHLDAQGKRLSSDYNDEFKNLTTWEDEPGWDTVVLIRGYTITQEIYQGNRARVTVFYQLKSKPPEKVVYRLRLINGVWKIDTPQTEPHTLTIPK